MSVAKRTTSHIVLVHATPPRYHEVPGTPITVPGSAFVPAPTGQARWDPPVRLLSPRRSAAKPCSAMLQGRSFRVPSSPCSFIGALRAALIPGGCCPRLAVGGTPTIISPHAVKARVGAQRSPVAQCYRAVQSEILPAVALSLSKGQRRVAFPVLHSALCILPCLSLSGFRALPVSS